MLVRRFGENELEKTKDWIQEVAKVALKKHRQLVLRSLFRFKNQQKKLFSLPILF